MRASLDTGLQFVLNDEGGYVERSNEPGGACNKGVSFLVFCEWRHKQGKPKPTFADLRALTDKEAKDIYTSLFSAPLNLDATPVPLDYVMLNTAVMQGVGGTKALCAKLAGNALSARELALLVIIGQMDLKMRDPNVGPHLDGFAAFAPGTTVADLMVALKRLDPQTKVKAGFGPGWANRIMRVVNRALAMK